MVWNKKKTKLTLLSQELVQRKRTILSERERGLLLMENNHPEFEHVEDNGPIEHSWFVVVKAGSGLLRGDLASYGDVMHWIESTEEVWRMPFQRNGVWMNVAVAT